MTGGVASGWDWSQLAGFALFIVLTSAVGMAIGAALHNTAAAIVSYFVLAGLFSLLMIPALQKAGDWINTGTTFGWMLTGDWSGHGAQIAVSRGAVDRAAAGRRHLQDRPPRGPLSGLAG